jgi:hypothetical protein
MKKLALQSEVAEVSSGDVTSHATVWIYRDFENECSAVIDAFIQETVNIRFLKMHTTWNLYVSKVIHT